VADLRKYYIDTAVTTIINKSGAEKTELQIHWKNSSNLKITFIKKSAEK
jgi:hypothetical protein